MTQDTAERKIKGLQKEFLMRLEQHPVFQSMEPREFNDLRKRVFRGTFEAYRLGVVGLDAVEGYNALYTRMFGWMNDATRYMTHALQIEVASMTFRVALEAYRIGAMVSVEREQE